MKPADWSELIRYVSLVTGIGLIIATSVWIGWQLGSWMEKCLGGMGWLVLGLLAGIGAGFTAVYSMLKKFVPKE